MPYSCLLDMLLRGVVKLVGLESNCLAEIPVLLLTEPQPSYLCDEKAPRAPGMVMWLICIRT